MVSLPTGTITFLFADVEGSTRLLERLGDRYANLLREYRATLRRATEEWAGREVDAQGDGLLLVFPRSADALRAAVSAQRALASQTWPDGVALRVRMGIHTGEPLLTPEGYVGIDVHRAARICAAAWGGQILVSQTTHALSGDELAELHLRDLGPHRLRDLSRPQRLFQAVAPDLPADFPPPRSLDVLPHNLPIQLTSFIGRELERAELRQLLARARLLTLTGVGGAGKTRLALQVAAEVIEDFPDGVWWVELAPLAEQRLVPQAVTSALGIREQPGRPLLATLTDYLEPKHLLLILDNCEHLVAACAEITETLLRAAPHLRMLTTSREPLRVPGEVVWWVPPLGLPGPNGPPSPGRLAESEAVRLFIDRASAGYPDFRFSEQNAAAVAQVCRQLDGLPLAIELAAARTRALSPGQIADRLQNRLHLLSAGSRTVLPRHQTMRAAMDWSHDLLSPQEKVLFGRLAVFAGRFLLEAAEAICAGDGIAAEEILDLLARLVDRSLVFVEDGRDLRYRLLQIVQEYARTWLQASGEEDIVRRRHRDWYLALAERADEGVIGPQELTWLERLEGELGNFRGALEWSLGHGDHNEALRLASLLWPLWFVRGYITEGRTWVEAALSASAGVRSPARARALTDAGWLAIQQGDFADAVALCEESLELSRTLGYAENVASTLYNLGFVATRQGDLGRARALLEESLALWRRGGHQYGMALALDWLGSIATAQSEYAEADRFLHESLARFRELGYRHGAAYSLHKLGHVASMRSDLPRARAFHQESLALFHDLKERQGRAYALAALGSVTLREGNYAEARSLLGESLTHFRDMGDLWGAASVQTALGMLARLEGDYEQAEALHEEALKVQRTLGDRGGIANSLAQLGHLALARQDAERAKAPLQESLALRRAVGDRRAIADALEGLAAVAVLAGDPARAARLLGAAAGLRDRIGAPLWPVERSVLEPTILRVRDALGEDAFEVEWSAGRRMEPEYVIVREAGWS